MLIINILRADMLSALAAGDDKRAAAILLRIRALHRAL